MSTFKTQRLHASNHNHQYENLYNSSVQGSTIYFIHCPIMFQLLTFKINLGSSSVLRWLSGISLALDLL